MSGMRVSAAVLATIVLSACATDPTDELRVRGPDAQRPDYIATDCARILAEARPIYDSDRTWKGIVDTGSDPRVEAIEARGAIMGCDPRR